MATRVTEPVLFWAHWVSGSGQRVERRNLTRVQLDDLRESVETNVRVEWGVERPEAA